MIPQTPDSRMITLKPRLISFHLSDPNKNRYPKAGQITPPPRSPILRQPRSSKDRLNQYSKSWMRSAQLQRFRYASMTAFEMSSNYLMLLIVSMGLAICSTERNSADVCMCIYYIYIYFRIRESCLIHVVILDVFRVLLVPCPVNSSTSHSKFIGLSLGQRNGLKVKVMNKQPNPWKPGRNAKKSFHKIYQNIPFLQTKMASWKIQERRCITAWKSGIASAILVCQRVTLRTLGKKCPQRVHVLSPPLGLKIISKSKDGYSRKLEFSLFWSLEGYICSSVILEGYISSYSINHHIIIQKR